MKLSAIKFGHWYETSAGIGQVTRVGGTHPPSVKIRITQPIPRGEILLRPRDVIKEIQPPPSTTTHP